MAVLLASPESKSQNQLIHPEHTGGFTLFCTWASNCVAFLLFSSFGVRIHRIRRPNHWISLCIQRHRDHCIHPRTLKN